MNAMQMMFMEEFLDTTTDISPWTFPVLPTHKQTPTIVERAVYYQGLYLKYVRPDLITNDICLLAVNQCGAALEFVPRHFQTQEVCEDALNNEGTALQYVYEQNEHLCLLAIESDSSALEYVENQTYEMCLKAVRDDWRNLEVVKKEFKTLELQQLSFEQSSESVKYFAL